MADTQAAAATAAVAPKAKRKPQGPRVNKPVFAIVRATDGSTLPDISITLERDAGKVVKLVTSAEGAQGAKVLEVALPEGPKRVAPAA